MERFSYNEQAHLWNPEGMDNGISLPDSEDIFDSAILAEQEPTAIIPFREWKINHYEAEVGNMITDVPPASLFTPQEWLRPEKWIRAVEAQAENTENAFTVKGIVYEHPKEHMGKVPVVLNGNHRAVNALTQGIRLNFLVVDFAFDGKPVWRIPNLRNRYGDMLVR